MSTDENITVTYSMSHIYLLFIYNANRGVLCKLCRNLGIWKELRRKKEKIRIKCNRNLNILIPSIHEVGTFTKYKLKKSHTVKNLKLVSDHYMKLT